MNPEPCPKCGTTIDLHYMSAEHERPEGGWCDFTTGDPGFWEWAERHQTCVRCDDEAGDGELMDIGEGYHRHVGVCPGAVCKVCGEGGGDLEWVSQTVRGDGAYWQHDDCLGP